MSPLPKPLATTPQPPGMQRRRKSSLRTAAGALQDQFLQRMAKLRDEPNLVLPESLGREPRSLAKLRRQIAALQAGRTPLAARFDVNVLGAVHRARQLADWEAVPRMLDAKVAGQRRFYVQRGQVKRACSLGVQNFDQPRVLLLAYGPLAQRHGLHFFALPDKLVTTGKAPNPPAQWFAAVAGDAFAATQESEGRWGCGHADRDRVLLQLRGGPGLVCCASCGERANGIHKRLRERYVGPLQKKPVDVHVLKADGTMKEPSREALARYRGGIAGELDIIRSAA